MREFPEPQAEAMADLNRRIDEAIDALTPEVAPLAAAIVAAHCAFLAGFWYGRTSIPSDYDASGVAEANAEVLNQVNVVISQRLKLTTDQSNTSTAVIGPLLAEMGDILDAAIGPPSNDRGLIIASGTV